MKPRKLTQETADVLNVLFWKIPCVPGMATQTFARHLLDQLVLDGKMRGLTWNILEEQFEVETPADRGG